MAYSCEPGYLAEFSFFLPLSAELTIFGSFLFVEANFQAESEGHDAQHVFHCYLV